MIGIIAAVTQNGIIGVENKLPFDYPADMKHFRATTANSIVIMGRKTFEGIGHPLPNRTNYIISNSKLVETYNNSLGTSSMSNLRVLFSVLEAVKLSEEKFPEKDIWFIGGAAIYEAGMEFADKIVLTLTPDIETRTPAVKFPWINPQHFKLRGISILNPEDTSVTLHVATYERYCDPI